MDFTAGDRVYWQYTHHLNSTSSVEKTKRGEYYGRVKHTMLYNGKPLAVVQFDGNKSASRVPIDELRLLKGEGGRCGKSCRRF